MPLTAAFSPLTFPDVPGYLLSAMIRPTQGIMGNFFAYLWLRYDAACALNPLPLGAAGPSNVADLTISGDARAYTLPGITLLSAEPGVSRRERRQFIEFGYPHRPQVAHQIKAVLKNEGTTQLQKSALDSDYTYGVDAFPEQLLGFNVRQSKSDPLVLRFASLRNNQNSFLTKLVELNNAQQQDAKKSIPSFEIKFAQGNINMTKDNLIFMQVTEAYGECLRWPQPGLSDYVQADAVHDVARFSPPSFSPADLVQHELQREFPADAPHYTVESATVVLQPGAYSNFAVR